MEYIKNIINNTISKCKKVFNEISFNYQNDVEKKHSYLNKLFYSLIAISILSSTLIDNIMGPILGFIILIVVVAISNPYFSAWADLREKTKEKADNSNHSKEELLSFLQSFSNKELNYTKYLFSNEEASRNSKFNLPAATSIRYLEGFCNSEKNIIDRILNKKENKWLRVKIMKHILLLENVGKSYYDYSELNK